LCTSLHSPVTSSLVGPNIMLRILFPNILSLYRRFPNLYILCPPLKCLIKFKLQNKTSFSQCGKGNRLKYWSCKWIWIPKCNHSVCRHNNTKIIWAATTVPLNFY
jgi:hypothetical protein